MGNSICSGKIFKHRSHRAHRNRSSPNRTNSTRSNLNRSNLVTDTTSLLATSTNQNINQNTNQNINENIYYDNLENYDRIYYSDPITIPIIKEIKPVRLPGFSFHYDSKHCFVADLECSICLCEYKQKEILQMLSCNHVYHKTCLTDWYFKQQNCPMCRARDINNL